MNWVREAKIAPATPVIAAERVNAAVRIITGSSPSEREASSESRTARIALPHALASRRAKRTTVATVRRATSSATSRSMKVYPKASGRGMNMIPFQPPVTSFHSAAPCSITKPNAMVTIAR